MKDYRHELENSQASGLPFSRYWWQILMALAFFLLWNDYRGKVLGNIHPNILKLAGAAILLFLAIVYTGESENDYQWMRTYWWGALGLIGWGYVLSIIQLTGLLRKLNIRLKI